MEDHVRVIRFVSAIVVGDRECNAIYEFCGMHQFEYRHWCFLLVRASLIASVERLGDVSTAILSRVSAVVRGRYP